MKIHRNVDVHDGSRPRWSGNVNYLITSKCQIQWWFQSIKVMHGTYHCHLLFLIKLNTVHAADCHTPITYIECPELRITKPRRSLSTHRHAALKRLPNAMESLHRIPTRIYTATTTQSLDHTSSRRCRMTRLPEITRLTCQRRHPRPTPFNRQATLRANSPRRHLNQLW